MAWCPWLHLLHVVYQVSAVLLIHTTRRCRQEQNPKTGMIFNAHDIIAVVPSALKDVCKDVYSTGVTAQGYCSALNPKQLLLTSVT